MKPVPDRWGSMPSDIPDTAPCSCCGKPVRVPLEDEWNENEVFLCAQCSHSQHEEERS